MCQHFTFLFILTVCISCHWQKPCLHAHGHIVTQHAQTLKEGLAICSTGHLEVLQHTSDELHVLWSVNKALMCSVVPDTAGHHLPQLHYSSGWLTSKDVEQFWGLLSQDGVHIFVSRVSLLIHGQTPSADTQKSWGPTHMLDSHAVANEQKVNFIETS